MKLGRLTVALLASSLTPFVTPASAETLVVDDDGGPAVDFTDLAAAVAAAADGDVLHILPGQYGNFFVSRKGLTLVGEAGVSFSGDSIVSDLGPDQVFVLSSVQNLSIWFDDCEGVVVLDDVTTAATCCGAPIIASRCADVRIQRSKLLGAGNDETLPSAELYDSRVEFSACSLNGQLGRNPSSNIDGAPALLIRNSRVHLAGTRAIGGTGASTADCSYGGGWAGAAIRLTDSGSEVVISGAPTTTVAGGEGGDSPGGLCNGTGGSAVRGGGGTSTLRASGAQLMGGADPAGATVPALDFDGLVDLPDERDPTLELLGTPRAGRPLRLRITGEPFARVTLMFGRDAMLSADATSTIERLTSAKRGMQIGVLDASGELTHTFVMPGNHAFGTALWLQAAAVSPGGDYERSNSAVLILRNGGEKPARLGRTQRRLNSRAPSPPPRRSSQLPYRR